MSYGFSPRMRSFSSSLSVISGVLLLFVGGLTVADVLNRNFRGQSILGVLEISSLTLVAIAFLGLTAAEIDGKHVTVSLLEERLGKTARMVLSVLRIAMLIILGIALLIGMVTVLESALARGETTNDILRLPTWPAKLVVLLSFLFFFATASWKELKIFRALRARQDPFEEENQAELARAAENLEAPHER